MCLDSKPSQCVTDDTQRIGFIPRVTTFSQSIESPRFWSSGLVRTMEELTLVSAKRVSDGQLAHCGCAGSGQRMTAEADERASNAARRSSDEATL